MLDETLAQEPGFLQMVLDNAKNSIFVKDEEFRIVYANKPFLNLYPPEERKEIIGKTTLENFPPDEVEAFLKEDRRALAGDDTEIIEEITDYQGNKLVLLTRKIGFTTRQGKQMLLGISSPINDLVEKEQKLAEMNLSLEKFITIAAHDLRSPLDTLVSYMDIIALDKDSNLSESSTQMLKDMRKSACNLMEQVSSLINLYKREGEEKKTDCDLNEIIAEVRYNLSNLISDKKAKIQTNDLPSIMGQAPLLRQLFQNMIENSLKHIEEKSPLIIIKSTYENNGYLFEIEDNGCGITMQQDPFDFVANGNGVPQRRGLGLSLCKNIISAFGGKIWVDHGYTEGCRICFFIPDKQNSQKTA